MKNFMKKGLKVLLVIGGIIGCLFVGLFVWAWFSPDTEEGGTRESNAATWKTNRGTSMNVDQTSGDFNVDRFVPDVKPEIGDEDTWTILVYLCGSDLESEGAGATVDFSEMLDLKETDSVRFVVETGGAKQWQNEAVKNDKLMRFVSVPGDMTIEEELPLAGMGESQTFSDFVTWGVENYPSEHMGVILWDHGSGSINGVCFDETTEECDSLTLPEMDKALFDSYSKTGRKFDFIGFDACLMGTVENANILATYSDYMYASQELEPGTGWDYTAIGDFLYKNPDANGLELGKAVSDSYMKSCESIDEGYDATFSVVDLSKIDNFNAKFNTFSKSLFEAGGDDAKLGDMVRGIVAADNFGGNNKSEGYTNMVDLGGILDACAPYTQGADEAKAALKEAVVYSVNGTTHANASGLSMYYPLSIQGSNELEIFGSVSLNPYYLAFVDRHVQSAAGTVAEGGYSDDALFNADGAWNYGENLEEGHWSGIDDYEATGESQLITFAHAPALDADGIYSFELDVNGYNNASEVHSVVFQYMPEGKDIICLGYTNDWAGDWQTGKFSDNFDGRWLALPDNQKLAYYVIDETDDYLVYTCPIYLNGEKTNLRIRHYFGDEGRLEVEGAWDGLNEYGAASRDVVKIKEGDVIVPAYESYNIFDDNAEGEYNGGEYVVGADFNVCYDYMSEAHYLFAFDIVDIYGDSYTTDPVMFDVDANGQASFYESLEDALIQNGIVE